MRINYSEMYDFEFMRWTMNLLLKFDPIVSNDPEYILINPYSKHNWYSNKKMILITNENHDLFPSFYPLKDYHAVVGLFPPNEQCNFVQFPLIAAHYDISIESLYKLRESLIQKSKTEFCCFISKNKWFGHLLEYRKDFFNKLSQYKQVISGGDVCNNTGCCVPKGLHGLRWINQFKFMICFENSIKKGYVTEKPFEPWFAGTIPIYVGDFSSLNSKAYINGLAEDAIEQIIKLDNDSELYENMRQEELTMPRISLNKFYHDFERQVLNK